MSCNKAGSYDEQRLAKKKYQLKKANQFKGNFIKLWEKYGEFETINGVKYFSGYRIDGDGEGQKKMSKRLGQDDLWQETDDKHFKWVKLYFNLGKLQTITDADVDAFFEDYKDQSHGKHADRLHYKLEVVQTPNDYGYYDTDKAVTEHWFDKKIVTVTQDANGNDVETITWEKIEGDDYLDELSWELADFALDSAVWFEDDGLTPITEIVADIEVSEVELDTKIDELRATEFVGGGLKATDGVDTLYKVATIGDKIREYTIAQSVGNNTLDELTYVQGFGDGKYYLSVDAAKKMNGLDFMKLVGKTLDFYSEMAAKYKWRKRLLAVVVVVGSALLIASGNVGSGVSLLSSYIGSVSHNSKIKIVTQMISIISSGGLDFSQFGATEAINLILNVASLHYAMQADNQAQPPEQDESVEVMQHNFYRLPYNIYDELYCYRDLIRVSAK